MVSRLKLPFQRRDLPAETGETLRFVREKARRTRRDVAKATGIAARTLARIERNAQRPRWSTLERLCQELSLSVFVVAPLWAKQGLDLPAGPASAPGLGLKALRLERKMTLVEVADRAGVSVATLSRFERGITASRLLGRRVGDPETPFVERDLKLDALRLAQVFDFDDPDAFEAACITAFLASE